MQKNAGNLDATLRFLLALFLMWLGLFKFNGLQGNMIGILISMVSIMPLYMAMTRKCFVFSYFKISSIPQEKSTKT